MMRIFQFRKLSKRRLGAIFLMFLVLVSVSGFLYVKFAFGVTRTWDGGGLTNNWNDCQNWSADTCPGTLDVAAFDGTSAKDATINAAIDVGGINIGAAYGGIITQASGITVNVRALDFIQAGGTFTGGDSAITIGAGNVTLSGGTFTNTSSTLTWTIGGTSKAFNTTGNTFSNPGAITFADASTSVQTLTCSGTFPGTVNIAQTSGASTFSLSSNCSITLTGTDTTQGSITSSGTITATNININDSANGGSVNFTQNGTLNLSGTLKFGATHSGSQTLTCSGNLTGSGGVVDVNETSGTNSFTLSSGCSVTMASSVSDASPITNNGTMAATTLTLTSGSFTNNGTLSGNININAGNFTQAVGGAFNSGTLKFNSSTSSATQTLTCTGNLGSGAVDDAQSSLSQSFVLSSNCTASMVAAVSTTGSITNNGTMNSQNISVGRDLTNNGTIVSSGTLTLDDISTSTTQTLTCFGNFPMTIDVKFDTFNNGTFVLGSGCTATELASDYIQGNLTINGILNATDLSISRNITVSGKLASSGTLTLDDATTSINQTIACTGTFPMTVDVKFDTFSNGTMTVGSGCAVTEINSDTVNGSVVVNGSLSATGLSVDRDFTLGSNGAFTGDLTFGSTNTTTLTCTNTNLNSAVTVNKGTSGTTFGLGSSCNIAGFTLSQGTVSNPGSNMTLGVSGDFAENASTTFGGANLTVKINGSGTQNISKTAGALSTPININKTSGIAQLAANFSTSADATVSAGMLYLNGKTFSTARSVVVQNGGNFGLFGNETTNTPTLNTGSTVTYTGTSGVNSYTLKSWSYYNIAFSQSAGTNTFNLAADTTIPGSVTISSGTLDAVSGSNFNLTVGGNWSNSGTFTPRSATVTFNDITQPSKISGTTTFNNLTVSTPSKKMWFKSGSSTTISGALTMNGAAGRYVQLQSLTPGSTWNIISNGSASLSFLEVQDSNACSGTTLAPTSSINLGNNSCWTLGSQQTNTSKVQRGTKFIRGSRVQ